jgi:exportin-1
LLSLTELKKGKENKAVVASNIMYIVGQYPRFLKANWAFLRTVVKKLFEFMHEPFTGVMEMACNTFLKIAEQTKEDFVVIHKPAEGGSHGREPETEPYLNEIIRRMPDLTGLLNPSLKLVFFEAIGNVSPSTVINSFRSYDFGYSKSRRY